MKTKYWIIILTLFFGLTILIVQPDLTPKEEDCLIAKGIVTEIYEGGINDVVFKLKGQDKIYYINRGLEAGFNLKQLRADLSGKEAVIKYPKYWTPLDPFNSSKHISKIESEGRTVYSEVD